MRWHGLGWSNNVLWFNTDTTPIFIFFRIHDWTKWNFWSLTLILRLWWSMTDMILSMCICSNTSKDVSARDPSRWGMWQGWSNLEGAFEEIHLVGTRSRARHHLASSPGLYVCSSHLNLFGQLAGRLKIGLKLSIGPRNEKILLPKNIFCPKFDFLLSNVNAHKKLWISKWSQFKRALTA